MRVTSGLAKGYKLKVPSDDRVKPAQSIVRQAIFNVIGQGIINARVLDLFAGSGSLGIEALSRGAAWADFVDRDKKVTKIIKKNLLHTNFREESKVYTLPAKRFTDNLVKSEALDKFDFIFLSPPYAQGVDRQLLQKIPKVLQSRGVLVFEHSKKTKLPEKIKGLKLLDQRTYGAATVSFLQKAEPS